ncbi:hypothetical protein KSS87_020226, partial [Heliosperma pusillum]
ETRTFTLNKVSNYHSLNLFTLKKRNQSSFNLLRVYRMLLPHLVSNGIDRDAFSFRQEEDDKQGHNKNPC